MKSSFHRVRDRMKTYDGHLLIASMVALGILLALTPAAKTASWKSKDWTKWTLEECQEILSNSPWAETYHLDPSLTDEGPGRRGVQFNIAATAVISSSLVIRQASLRQLQHFQDKFPATPERKQKLQDSFSKQVASCLGQNFDDQIVVTVYDANADDFNTGPEMEISGRKYQPISVPQADRSGSPCPQNMTTTIGRANVFAYPRVENGTPIIAPDDTKIIFKTPKYWRRDFEFNAKNMIYKGKPDF
jgi:hypothetical protein